MYVPAESTMAAGQRAKRQQREFLFPTQTKTAEKTPPRGA